MNLLIPGSSLSSGASAESSLEGAAGSLPCTGSDDLISLLGNTGSDTSSEFCARVGVGTLAAALVFSCVKMLNMLIQLAE